MVDELKAKRQRDRFVEDWEDEERLGYRAARKASRLWPKSRVAGGLSRRDLEEDRWIFEALQGALNRQEPVILGHGKRPPVIKGGYLKIEPRDEEAPREPTTIWVPDWTHSGPRMKLVSYGATMLAPTPPLAFTLRLGEATREAMVRSSRGPVGYMSERLSRHLRAAGDADAKFVYALEASPLHDPHLHGMIRTDLPLRALRKALEDAGGPISLASGRQAHTRPVYDLKGWVEYITKASLLAVKELKRLGIKATGEARRSGILGASQAVRSDGAEWYRRNRGSGVPIYLPGLEL